MSASGNLASELRAWCDDQEDYADRLWEDPFNSDELAEADSLRKAIKDVRRIIETHEEANA
ncbi:hypothetical protein [Micrococcus sp. TA1]|uniref:hypothetical protein n=1 Tax=Micrococcus sp. TA1 TaxID=681627 RepID=UPI00161BFF5E|nr:hypothetical protein [Micrococcus sp. TA1]MBB5748519.1 hypothetical protein [Micrococcus sp. TA1]